MNTVEIKMIKVEGPYKGNKYSTKLLKAFEADKITKGKKITLYALDEGLRDHYSEKHNYQVEDGAYLQMEKYN